LLLSQNFHFNGIIAKQDDTQEDSDETDLVDDDVEPKSLHLRNYQLPTTFFGGSKTPQTPQIKAGKSRLEERKLPSLVSSSVDI